MTKLEKEQKRKREVAAKLSNPRPFEMSGGRWRCQIMVAGERISIVDDDPAVAHAKAVAMKKGLIELERGTSDMTLGEAIDRYIESKDSVLSPATVAGYKRIRKAAFQELMNKSISALSQEDIQRAVNKMAKDKSPKSVANAHGLLSATLGVYRPQFVLRTTLPQKQKQEMAIPSGEDVARILEAAMGSEMEIPILLALWLGLRASEIRGITWDAISNDVLHVKSAIVEGEDGAKVKGTKTYSGNRKLKIPSYLLSLINEQPKTDEYVVHLSGQAMYKRFSRLCEKHGIPHYRFHDLRHANASIMLAMGVPDKYAMERMGHSTNHMLKSVYQHTMKEKQAEVASKIDDYFEKLLANYSQKNDEA